MPAYFSLPFSALLLIGLLLYIIWFPYLREFESEPNVFYKIVYILFFFADVAIIALTFFVHNMFVYDRDGQRSQRDVQLQMWAMPVMIFLILALISSALVVFIPE